MKNNDQQLIIYFDQELIKPDQAFLDSITPGVLNAKGVFETMLIKEGAVRLFDEHFKRMRAGAHALGISLTFSINDICAMLKTLMKKNDFSCAKARISIWQQADKTHTAIVLQPIIIDDSMYQKGYTVGLEEIDWGYSPMSCFKTYDYAPFRKAYMSAVQKSCDEAIVMNRSKEVIEGARTNVFMVIGSTIITPPLSTGCLEGVTRAAVKSIAQGLSDISYKETTFGEKEIISADEVFVTNAVLGVMPVTCIEETSINFGKSGPITEKIMRQYNNIAPQKIYSSA